MCCPSCISSALHTKNKNWNHDVRFESYNAHYYQMKLSHQSALKSDATVRTTARTPKVGSKGTTTSLYQPAKDTKKK